LSLQERLEEYLRLQTLGKAFGIYSEVLSPLETTRLFPILDASTLHATLYSPTDGNVDPSSLCTALTRYATSEGAGVIEGCEVTGIRARESVLGTRDVTGVDTNFGFIETPVLINCTGKDSAGPGPGGL
jgi:sarcosine dehydrogenase